MHIDTLKCSSILESKGFSKPLADAIVSMAANILEKVVTNEDIAHFATKQDLSELRLELKQDMSELRHELKQDMSELRQELKQDMSKLHQELKHDISFVRTDMYRLALMQTFALAGIIIAAVKFL